MGSDVKDWMTASDIVSSNYIHECNFEIFHSNDFDWAQMNRNEHAMKNTFLEARNMTVMKWVISAINENIFDVLAINLILVYFTISSHQIDVSQ